MTFLYIHGLKEAILKHSFLYIQFWDKMNAGVACIFYSELIVVISVKFFLTNVNCEIEEY